MPDSPRSLGDERTQAGLPSEAASPARSLGDQSTHAEGVSSVSDLGTLAANLDETLELTDLTARYEFGAVIGRGGMGEVLLARDKRLERTVAIKRILGEGSGSATALRRFLTEARSLAQLNHFNIVQVYDYGRDAQGPFLILEFVPGKSLQDRLKEGSLPVEQAVDMACQLCDGLGAAHKQGIIHRDVKPANVLLTQEGEPKLTDFGLAHRESGDGERTQAGAVLGTIDFMPPEQRRDATQADARSDLWSLAATLYQMLTGKSPKVIRLDQVPEALRAVLGKALEEEPAERYPTTAEFKTALRAATAILRTASAQPAQAVLVEGVCPQCKTQNDLSRKFCKSCRSSLTVECLSCRTVIKVWEDVCGECGVSQQEQLAQRLVTRENQLEQAAVFGREYRFEESLALCGAVAQEVLPSLADLRDRATTLTTELTARRDEQLRLRTAIVAEAQTQFDAAKYETVLTELEKVPAALCDTAVEELRSEAQRRILKLTSLLTDIERLLPYREDEYDSREKLDRLEDLTARFLELQPNHDRVTRVQQATQFAKAESRHRLQSGHEQRPPAQPRPDQEAYAKRLGTTIEITNSIGMQLTLIPPGEFLMGSPAGDTDAKDYEKPQHKVRITKPYYLGIHAVTQRQWQSLMGTEPWNRDIYEQGGPDSPATYVSWEDATEFCRKLSKKEGKTYRLPTEAEWEYACRAGTTTKFHFGDDESQLGDYAWYYENANNQGETYAHAVGQKKPNAWGLYDMHGNVSECCSDWYDAQYYGQSPEADPQGPADGSLRVFRGLDWLSGPELCRSGCRHWSRPDFSECDLGFRVVLVPAATPTATSPVTASKPVAAAAASSPALKPSDMQMNSLGMQLTLIPAGEFLMGSQVYYSAASDDEKPQHKVRITKPYYLGIHEVTQGQWQSLMGTEPWQGQIYVKAGTDFPATYVSWEEATEFCCKLSKKEGKTYRLPTEAEWEYACRAGTTTKYHFGDDESQLGDYAWYGMKSTKNWYDVFRREKYAHAVGQKKPNAWGLYDMHGNVWEWCSDWYDEKYYGQSPESDPQGPTTGSRRVYRGGSWRLTPAFCRSAIRNWGVPDTRHSGLGFRVALVP